MNHLLTKFGEANIFIQDHWEADNFAIGIADKTKKYLVYISTFQIEYEKYYVALENPSNNNSLPYPPSVEYDNISLEKLEQIVSEHLKLMF